MHVFDQGEAFAFWLGLLVAYQLRFVLRWRKDYKLLDAAGNQRLTWKIAQGKRGWSQRWVWDARRSRWVVATVLALPVAHAAQPDCPLWLVVCRSQGRSPWYLLTAEAIDTDVQAWGVVFAYMRRWQIELSWKYEKSELAEHPSARLRRRSTGETAAAGDAGLRLFADLTARQLPGTAALVTPLVLSPHWPACPHEQAPTHPPALRRETACGKSTLLTSPPWHAAPPAQVGPPQPDEASAG